MNEQAVRDEAKRIHHEDVPWHECPWCVKFYRDDENGAAENARLTAKLHAQDLTLENVRSDIGLLLEALGKPNVARPISAHEVMLECIEAVKKLREKRAEHEHALRTRADYDFRCQDCGAPHNLDTSLPSDKWTRIAENPGAAAIGLKEVGALCTLCIDDRLAKAGITDVECEFYFTGKAMRSRTYDLERSARRNEVQRALRECQGTVASAREYLINRFAALRTGGPEPTKDAVEQERKRIVNLLCDRCRAGEPVVERRLPNMGLGHTLPGIPHPGWARCYAEEIHADLRSRSTTPAQSLYGPIDDPQYAIDPPSESPSLTRLKAAAADLDAMVKGGAMCQANLGTLELGCRKPLRHDGQHEGECAGYLITWGESRKG